MPSETATTMDGVRLCSAATRETKSSGSKATSGRQIIAAPSQSSCSASAAAAVSQPALRPMISTTVTDLRS